MSLTLRIENVDTFDDGSPTWIELDRKSASVGRKTAMDWVLPDRARFISGHHFDVSYSDSRYWLTDTSSNGTYIQGQSHRVQSPYALQDGDRLVVGHYIIVVSLPGAEPVVHAPAPVIGQTWAALQQPPDGKSPDEGDGWDLGAKPQAPINPLPPPRPGVRALDDAAEDLVPLQRPGLAQPPAFESPGSRADGLQSRQSPQPPGHAATPSVPQPQPHVSPDIPSPAPPDQVPPGSTGWTEFGGALPVDPGTPTPDRRPSDLPPDHVPPSAPSEQPSVPPPPAREGSLPPAGAAPAGAPLNDSGLPRVPQPGASISPRQPVAPPPPVPEPPTPLPFVPGQTGGPRPPDTAAHPADAEALLRAFCEGAGIDLARTAGTDPAQLAHELGRTVRVVTDEVMHMLHDRTEVRRFTHVAERTMRSAEGNNPLKFMANQTDALDAMFLRPREGFTSGAEGLQSALSDLRLHQMAVFAALQPALAEVLGGLSPDEIEDETKNRGSKLGPSRRGRNWDLYTERWDERAKAGDNGMLDAFMEAFARLYGEAIRSATNDPG